MVVVVCHWDIMAGGLDTWLENQTCNHSSPLGPQGNFTFSEYQFPQQ